MASTNARRSEKLEKLFFRNVCVCIKTKRNLKKKITKKREKNKSNIKEEQHSTTLIYTRSRTYTAQKVEWSGGMEEKVGIERQSHYS